MGRGRQQRGKGVKGTRASHQPEMSMEEAMARLQAGGDEEGEGGGQKQIRLTMWDFGQCDAAKCSGRKLARFGLVRTLKVQDRTRGIVLSPAGKQSFSKADLPLVLTGGLCVVDCSWARIDEIPFDKLKGGQHRLLPFLIAANPINYGRPFKLTCAEALAAALAMAGAWEQAKDLMSKFKWGHSFFELNEELLQKYEQCANSAEVVEVQNEFLERAQRESEGGRRPHYEGEEGESDDELPSNPNHAGRAVGSGSEDEEDEEEEEEEEDDLLFENPNHRFTRDSEEEEEEEEEEEKEEKGMNTENSKKD
mmetsp:Transcript_16767/g.42104  ORF Transcript_16767/g.42104 Transcript_16767/m.42104 type:complete len:308 (-) Transcript_16767:684-1607(-)|eukprot:CAMPEP_0113901502 /NCGR_PEP_ID=MMETSP0780_2-20120614/21284_1 /TAXON_ID=652834 /ORGANISM="Palpitomonas bilix" /LENGTH=307 /DNA_ID=CAMNT_0000894111 /DNA_START=121 /DNA_END=1044 /DNA_ORIENTATION=+ /assembly_acc=CAM_ASM_000599